MTTLVPQNNIGSCGIKMFQMNFLLQGQALTFFFKTSLQINEDGTLRSVYISVTDVIYKYYKVLYEGSTHLDDEVSCFQCWV